MQSIRATTAPSAHKGFALSIKLGREEILLTYTESCINQRNIIMPPSKSKYPIRAPLSTFATVSFYVNDPNFKSRLTKEERPRCFTVSGSSHPKPLNVFRYRTYYSDSPELPATDRGTSGDIWSSGTPGKPSNSSGLQHWVKISGSWVRIEPDSDERVHHPFLPNVYLLERFWAYDSDVDRQAEPLGEFHDVVLISVQYSSIDRHRSFYQCKRDE